jgi:hypothetical protein
MAKKNKNLPSLTKQLSSLRVEGVSRNPLLEAANLARQGQSGLQSTSKHMSLGDKTLSTRMKNATTGIRFGSPSNSRMPGSQSSNPLTNLLEHAASGGIGGILSGGLSSFAGLGGLVSGIIHLFGGGSGNTLPPLVEFRLPDSQQQTVYVSSKGNATFQGTAVEQVSRVTTNSGIYRTSNEAGSAGGSLQALRYQSEPIAQAVKTALLNSSSLNDVIAEI